MSVQFFHWSAEKEVKPDSWDQLLKLLHQLYPKFGYGLQLLLEAVNLSGLELASSDYLNSVVVVLQMQKRNMMMDTQAMNKISPHMLSRHHVHQQFAA